MNPTTVLRLLLVLACLFVAPRAWAAEDCNVLTPSLNFGAYDPTSAAPVTVQGTIEVWCRGNALQVTIALGTGGSNSYANRRMTNGTDDLFYNLYLDAGHGIVFGDGAGGSSTASCFTGSANNGCTGDNPSGSDRRAIRPVYGLLPGSQNVGVGTYTDTITYTVTF